MTTARIDAPPSAARRAGRFVLAFACLAAVGYSDFRTGYEISFAVFYLIPVGVLAWSDGARAALMMAVLSSIVWYSAEIAAGYPYTHAAIPVWNAFVRLVFFVLVAILFARQRTRLKSESILARTDPLTSLWNRRVLIEQLEHDLALCERTGQTLALAYIDLDDFKQINDRHGHAIGDDVLRAIAAAITSNERRSDTAARLGGDEFAIVVPGTDEHGVREFLRRLTNAIESSELLRRYGVTCSVGAIIFHDLHLAAADALAVADKLMYSVKHGGKSSVCIARWPATDDEAPPLPARVNAR